MKKSQEELLNKFLEKILEKLLGKPRLEFLNFFMSFLKKILEKRFLKRSNSRKLIFHRDLEILLEITVGISSTTVCNICRHFQESLQKFLLEILQKFPVIFHPWILEVSQRVFAASILQNKLQTLFQDFLAWNSSRKFSKNSSESF